MNILLLLKPKSTVAYIYSDNTLRQGLERMRAHHYTAIPVLSHAGEYMGTVNEGDFLWHMLDGDIHNLKEEEEYKVADIVRSDWNPSVKIDETMEGLLLKVMEQNFVPVVDDRNLFMGIITRKDVIKYFYETENINSTEQTSDKVLMDMAKKAMGTAYAPYSDFKVGAAVLGDDGKIYTGCNIENASYGATLCAERTAISKCISHGCKTFSKVAIASSKNDKTFPCGICRQVMSEFMSNAGVILLESKGDIVSYTLEELLPESFKY